MANSKMVSFQIDRSLLERIERIKERRRDASLSHTMRIMLEDRLEEIERVESGSTQIDMAAIRGDIEA